MYFNPTQSTPNPTSSDWWWFNRLHCLACWMILLWHGMNSGVKLKIDISMNLHFRGSGRNPYSRKKDICFWSHIAWHTPINIRMNSPPLPLTEYELIPHSTQISQHYQETQTSLWDWKLNNSEVQWHVQSAPNFIAQGLITIGALWKE